MVYNLRIILLSVSFCSIHKTNYSQYEFLNAPLFFYNNIDKLNECLWNKEVDCFVNLFVVSFKSNSMQLLCAPKYLIEILKIELLSTKVDLRRIFVFSEQKRQNIYGKYFHIDVKVVKTDVY